MGKSGKPFMPNLEPLIASGILRNKDVKCDLKGDVKKFLRVIDEQDAVNRYVWYNLPCDLTSQDVERLIYFKGQICFFFDKNTEKFYFMPYAGEQIDFYGRFKTCHPVPIASEADVGKDRYEGQKKLLDDIKLNVIYGIQLEEEIDSDKLSNSCVLLHDYTKQVSQRIIPRQLINDSILDIMADCVPFMRTCLLSSTGVRGVRVNDADQADSVDQANRSLETAALIGEQLVPIVGQIEFQELTDKPTSKSEEYMLAMQSLDNLRLSGYGIDNGGLFEKKAHELQSEADINGGPVGLVLQDGLSIRQNFCNIVNSIWGLGIWCEPAENIMGADIDGDGLDYDRNDDGTQSGIDTEGGNEDDSNV